MTTGRINQVATNRFCMKPAPSFRSRSTGTRFASVCGISIASLHQFRNCPVPLLRPSACAPRCVETQPGNIRRRRKDGLCCTSTVEFNSCSELRRGVLPGACNCNKSTVAKQPLIHTTPIQEHRSSRAGLTGTRC